MRSYIKIRKYMVFIFMAILDILIQRDFWSLKVKILHHCIPSYENILIAMILYLGERLSLCSLSDLEMFVGFVRVGINKFLSLQYHSPEKMVKILCTFILIFKNFSPDSLIFRMLKLNIKQWCHLESIDIFLHGIISYLQILVLELAKV